ncbi:MAG: Hsp20/alpha crystallin family protein [Bacteroidales bacterium]
MTLVKTNRPASQMFRDNRYSTLSDIMNDMYTSEKLGNTTDCSAPPANIIESKFDFRIEMAVPGFEKSDFKIDLDKKMLTISLDKNVDENTEEKCNYKEFNYNKFSRTFRLSDKIDTEKINALYKNGLLQVVLPKKEEAIEKPARQIKIS